MRKSIPRDWMESWFQGFQHQRSWAKVNLSPQVGGMLKCSGLLD